MSRGSSERHYVGPQPELNLGTLGHVDNGKSTVVQSLTGVWPSRHSEELIRGITIRVGYADVAFYKCSKCDEPLCYCTSKICPNCGSETEFLRGVSFVDCPGHHSLMVTMLAGATLMDGALLVLDANEKCPQPQDREHLAAAEIVGIDKIVLVQNKIDIVSRDRALESYNEINDFIKDTIVEDVPLVPVSAQHSINMDVLVRTIEEQIPTPKRNLGTPIMYVVRSFDVNNPGAEAEDIVGGVVGGSILQGRFALGDEIEISPGIRIDKDYESIYTEVTSLQAGGRSVNEVKSGGLVGVGTFLDPSLTKADGLVGNMVGKPGKLPTIWDSLQLDTYLFERVIGTEELMIVKKIKNREPLVLNIGTSVTSGLVKSMRDDIVTVSLRRPICAESNSRVAISRRIGDGWRLIGHGIIK